MAECITDLLVKKVDVEEFKRLTLLNSAPEVPNGKLHTGEADDILDLQHFCKRSKHQIENPSSLLYNDTGKVSV